MHKTTVYLDDETAVVLKQLSRTQGRTRAELIREALEQYLQDRPRKRPRGFGAYRSGRSDISERAEELLAQAAERRR